MTLFQLLGVLIAAYVVQSLIRGEVYAKSGIWGRTYQRDDNPARFWSTVVIYSMLSLALIFLF
jgi:hypothetical protein